MGLLVNTNLTMDTKFDMRSHAESEATPSDDDPDAHASAKVPNDTEAVTEADDGNPFPWPPTNGPPQRGHMKFFRQTYDLDLCDAGSTGFKVIVGSSNHSTFYLPLEALCSKSGFFRNALNLKAGWKETVTRTCHLPTIEPAVFDLFARWLYSGAHIMVDEDDWKAEYTEYLKWRLDLEHDKENFIVDPLKRICPFTVWDFALTTKAWLLGDYLLSPDFQNHCMCHLYYMNLRFDYILQDPDYKEEDDRDECYWHCGTLAYLDPEDILLVFENSDLADNCGLQLLKNFYCDWLKRYWDTYQISDWDCAARDGIDNIIEYCPSLAKELFRGLMSWKDERRWYCMKPLGEYWVDPINSAERQELYNYARYLDPPHRRASETLELPYWIVKRV
jgi:hypothetical protein